MIEWLTSLAGLLPAGGWPRFAADAIWQSTFVAGSALVIARMLHDRASLRAGVLLLAAALCVVAPVASLAMRVGGYGLLATTLPIESESPAAPIAAPHSASGATIVTESPVVNAPPATPVPPAALRRWGWTLVGVLWIGASTLLATRLAASALAMRRVCRAAEPYDDAAMLDELHRAATAFGVRSPELLRSADVATPAVVAWGRPRLLLPMLPSSGAESHAVFCHELAHLARRDGLSQLLTEAVVVAIPWQPLVWLLRRELRTACEEACDDWTVAAGVDPLDFAAILTDSLPRTSPAWALGMSESVAATRHRILRLLAIEGIPRPRLGRSLGIAGWIVAGGLAIVLALFQQGSFPDGKQGSGGPGSEDVTPLLPNPENAPPWGDKPIAEVVREAKAKVDALREKNSGALPAYVIEPPDVLMINAVKLVPKPPVKLEPLESLQIVVVGTLQDQPIAGPYTIEADGSLDLGFSYGALPIAGKTLTEARAAIRTHLENVLNVPEVYVSLAESASKHQIAGEHLVGPDGAVNLGIYGRVRVDSMTIAQARAAIEAHLKQFFGDPKVSIDVQSNSKVYYIVFRQGGGRGDRIMRFPITGNETVLDALAHINGLTRVSSKTIWVARPAANGNERELVLPVDWIEITKGASTATNWQLFPGDRLFILDNRGDVSDQPQPVPNPTPAKGLDFSGQTTTANQAFTFYVGFQR